MSESLKKKLRSFLIQLGIALAAFAVIAWNMGVMQAATALQRAHIICDAAFVVAVFFGGVGALMLISTTGFFDILGFGMKSFWNMFTPFGKLEEMPDFYAYKLEKAEARGATRWEMFAVGMVMLAISVIALMLFHRFS